MVGDHGPFPAARGPGADASRRVRDATGPVLLAAVLAGGCVVRDDDGATPPVAESPARSAGDAVASDTPSSPRSPLPAPPGAAWAGDTSVIVASASELDALAGAMTIPVAGVRAADLYDSYEEMRGTRVHAALDIHAERGTPVLSSTDGIVLKRHESLAGGLMLYAADPGDRFILMYGHLEGYAPGIVEGMQLRRGQVIGYVGTSGNAAANTPHLHFAVARGRPSSTWWLGTPVNPYPLLSAGSR
jgi:peptidoglycan LD-endopeptidase LytH